MSGAIDFYVERCMTRMPQQWVVSRVMQGYLGLPNRCWLSLEPGSAAITEESRFRTRSWSGSLRPAKNLPRNRVGHWDGILRLCRPHRDPVFLSSRLGILAILGHRCGSVSYTHLRAHETPEHLVCRLLLEK